jgi:hypothetical protein
MPMNNRLMRPLASGFHPEAAAWRSAVIANGGSASTSTVRAVSNFCAAIDAAGIRDRFYRLGIFAGSNLNAALVPLYLTPNSTVRNLFQFGTDMTNAAWLGGGVGVVTRTATSEAGPLGYGYATKLSTPTAPFDVRQMHQRPPATGQQATVSVWMKTNAGTKQIQWIIGNVYSDTVTVTSTWQRFSKTFTLPSSGDARTGLSTVSELNDAGHILVWGMQCEYGATATDYTQPRYGNATDTSNAFVGVGTDYAETGASGGLTGNGTTKYLNTGLTSLSLPDPAVGHLSAWGRSQSFGRSGWVSSFGASYANGAYIEFNSSAGSLLTGWGREQNISSSLGTGKHFLINRSTSTSQIAYANGSSIGETAAATTMPGNSAAFAIFARNVNGSIEAFTDARLNCYSIGAALSSADVLAYYSALNTFYTALGRA